MAAPEQAPRGQAQPEQAPSGPAAGVARALAALCEWPVGLAAGGVVLGPPSAHQPLVATTVGDTHRSLPWASVTKLCTAWAVLVAIEEGTLAWDTPAGPPGATVVHLLSHASGLAPTGDAVLAAPGRRRIYSNGGYEVLGVLLAERAGMPFATYLSGAVLEPLGMSETGLERSGSAASGVSGSSEDLLRLARELLVPRLVHQSTRDRAVAVAFPGLDGVLPGFGRQQPCDWGLGPEVRGHKRPHWTGTRCSPRTFGHFGQSGCFLWVDPVVGVALGVLTDRPFGPWAAAAWPAVSDAVLAAVLATTVPGSSP